MVPITRKTASVDLASTLSIIVAQGQQRPFTPLHSHRCAPHRITGLSRTHSAPKFKPSGCDCLHTNIHRYIPRYVPRYVPIFPARGPQHRAPLHPAIPTANPKQKGSQGTPGLVWLSAYLLWTVADAVPGCASCDISMNFITGFPQP